MSDGMSITPSPDVRISQFNNRQAQVASLSLGALGILIGIAVFASSNHLQGAVCVLFGLAFGTRGWVSSSIQVSDQSILLRSIAYARRYNLADVESVDVTCGRTGLNGFGREYLVFAFRDGQKREFKDFNARPPRSSDGASVVRYAASVIAGRLRGRGA